MSGDLSKNLKKLVDNFDDGILSGLEYVGQKIENTTKESVDIPTNSAILKASITHEVKPNENAVIVGTSEEYAPYVHEGTGIYATGGNGRTDVPWKYQDAKGRWHSTKGQKPNPFLRRAIDKEQGTILKKLGEGVMVEWMK